MVSEQVTPEQAEAYVREHEQKIEEQQQEIEWLRNSYKCAPEDNCRECAIAQRIIAMLEAQLAELLRGFKEAKP